jgi:hypothetical protein
MRREAMVELAVDLYQHCYWGEEDVRYGPQNPHQHLKGLCHQFRIILK